MCPGEIRCHRQIDNVKEWYCVMNEIDIRKVSTKKELRDFVQLPYKLYAGNSCYVPDLESDIYNVFNPSQIQDWNLRTLCRLWRTMHKEMPLVAL